MGAALLGGMNWLEEPCGVCGAEAGEECFPDCENRRWYGPEPEVIYEDEEYAR